MEYRVIKINELDKANELYRYVIKFCKTWDWNENYPSVKMIEEDIVNHQLVGLFDNNQLICCYDQNRQNSLLEYVKYKICLHIETMEI